MVTKYRHTTNEESIVSSQHYTFTPMINQEIKQIIITISEYILIILNNQIRAMREGGGKKMTMDHGEDSRMKNEMANSDYTIGSSLVTLIWCN